MVDLVVEGGSLSPYRWWIFWRHMARLQLGLLMFGLAIALMLEAHIGLDPWSAFHEAVSARSGLSFGRVSQGVGLLLILFSASVLAVRPGIATVFNMLVVGPWVDLLREQAWLPVASGGLVGVAQFLCAILVMGLASAVYIGARLGAGPRDGLAMGLSRRIERSLRFTRNGVEVTVLGVAAILGGSIGLGTLIFALLMGPTMQASLKLFSVSHDPSPSLGRVSAEEPRRPPLATTGETTTLP
ncbi:MAG: hypothetical protein O2958_15020 [Gemmatimonadetes bacterium]|nr:hypothetical protein [Gemmatimonadota bacterium]MDA1104536.1 hypothetical protein [Gemmatimonadota bacterium]